jgi:hypothetical protein
MLESEVSRRRSVKREKSSPRCLDVPKFWAAANSVADASPEVAKAVIRAAMRDAPSAPRSLCGWKGVFPPPDAGR